ncbi:MAG: inositol monophosphatase family protein [Anaerolineae bacterium]
MPTQFDLTAALALTERIAKQAGRLIMDIYKRPASAKGITMKGPIDVVTEADTQSEKLIADALLAAYPEHHIIGEESGGMGAPRQSADYLWHVDPVDGTTNFARGIPAFAVSIGLSDANNVPLLGVVYDPLHDECFVGYRGGGAKLGRKKLRVSKVRKLADALLASGFPTDRRVNPDNNTEEWSAFVTRSQSVRRFGSAAIELAYVACGRIDGFWEPRLKTWDCMAGMLLVEEAGGRVSDYRNRTDNAYNGLQVVASNGRIHEQMLEVIILGHAAPRA